MAPNILVNDGGAPARIMKLGLALANFDAGTMVSINGSGKIHATLDDLPGVELQTLGVLFVDAVSGEPCSVITGSGIMVYLKIAGAGGTIAAGHGLSHDTAGLAKIAQSTDMRVAIALEAESATNTGYVKALLI